MRKVLPGTIYLLLSFLLPSLTTHAESYLNTPVGVSITAPANITVNTDLQSNTATGISLGIPITTGDSVSVSNDSPNAYPIGVTIITWTAIDQAGNNATATQTVTVADNEKPYISRRGQISVANEPGKCGAAVKLMVPFAYDNSGSVSITSNAPAFFPVGSLRIIWTATDMYGNSDTSTQLITVIDNELPVISIGSNVQVGNDAGKCGAVVNLATPLTSDNCGVTIVTNNAPSFFPVGKTDVVWTVKDKAGYTVTAIQSVTVTDSEKPVITAPATITVNNDPGRCGAMVSITAPVASDNCGINAVTGDAPVSFPTGTTIISWTVTDYSGNSAYTTQSVIVKDAEAPVLSGIPADASVECDNIPPAALLQVSDNCDQLPAITFTESNNRGSDPNLSSFYNYKITRTWKATDKSGNSTNAIQVLTINDKTAPVISTPANITVNNDARTCGAAIKYAVTAVDNCGSPVEITYSKLPGTVFVTGSTIVTVWAKDASGNTASASFTVTVNDMEKPTITAPAGKTVTLTGSSKVATNVVLGTPVTSDNCGIKEVSNNAPVSYPVGITNVTWIVKDNSGNINTAIQTVTVNRRKTDEFIMKSAFSTIERSTGSDLSISVAPNPSTGYFTLRLIGNSAQPLNLRITDVTGKMIETRGGLTANSTVQVGHNYPGGLYYAEVIQGSLRKIVQLIKLR